MYSSFYIFIYDFVSALIVTATYILSVIYIHVNHLLTHARTHAHTHTCTHAHTLTQVHAQVLTALAVLMGAVSIFYFSVLIVTPLQLIVM